MSDNGPQIIEKAIELGAAMAGIASVELLKKSPSHKLLQMETGLEIRGFAGIRWPAEAKSILVIAVSHPQDRPELDWWDTIDSPGNRTLIKINRELSDWIETQFGRKTHRLPYHITKGGTYLKDAAVLSGLGCIGRNNLLITPELGPRVRLRALLLEEELTPTGPIAFDPCEGCGDLCKNTCPQNAFKDIVLSPVETGFTTLPGRDGCFSRASCMVQMEEDVDKSRIDVELQWQSGVDTKDTSETDNAIKYCRRCELACPVGN